MGLMSAYPPPPQHLLYPHSCTVLSNVAPLLLMQIVCHPTRACVPSFPRVAAPDRRVGIVTLPPPPPAPFIIPCTLSVTTESLVTAAQRRRQQWGDPVDPFAGRVGRKSSVASIATEDSVMR